MSGSHCKIERHISRRILSVLLSLCVLITVIPGFVIQTSADYETPLRLMPKDASTSAAVTNETWYTDTSLSRYTAAYGTAGSYTLGDAEHPYLIETGLELANLAMLVNGGNTFAGKHIKLTGSISPSNGIGENVIDLIGASATLYSANASGGVADVCGNESGNTHFWTPIGASATMFLGSFDGNNIKVYNLGANTSGALSGLFGYLGSGAEVKNILLYDTQLYSTGAATVTGAVAAYTATGSTITGCAVNGITPGNRTVTQQNTSGNSETFPYTVPDFTLRSNGASSITGGIVGRSDGGTIENCNFYGSIVSQSSSGTGGIVGYNSGDGATTVTGCTVSGLPSSGNPTELELIMPGGTYAAAGGAVGKASGAALLTVSNLSSPGGIRIATYKKSDTKDLTSMIYRVGGIIGEASSTNLSITGICSAQAPLKVWVNGKINSDSGKSSNIGGIGGIIGYMNITNNNANISVTGCSVSFNALTASNTEKNNIYYGGIIGRVKTSLSQAAAFTISGCNVSDSKLELDQELSFRSNAMFTSGGIIGGLDSDKLTGSSVTNCTVTNLSLSSDGLSGGILGLAATTGYSGIGTISDCEVNGLKIIPVSDDQYINYLVFGGIVPKIKDSTIYDCTVTGTTIKAIRKPGGPFTDLRVFIGGIAGYIDGSASTSINHCTTDITVQLSVTADSNSIGGHVGGIAAASSGTCNITGCVSNLDFSVPTEIINDIQTTPKTYTQNSTRISSYTVGGLVGTVYSGTTTVTGSISTGNIDTTVSNPSDSGSVVGGIAGSVNTALTISASSSTASLGGNINDAVGGIAGFNAGTLSLDTVHFGGTLLVPWAASVVELSSGTVTAADVTRNAQTAPNAPSANTEIPVTDSTVIPDLSTPAGTLATAAVRDAFNTAARTPLVTISSGHVFSAVAANIQAGSYYTADKVLSFTANLPLTVSFTKNVTANVGGTDVSIGSVTRKIHFVSQLAGHTTEYGTAAAPYNISSAADITALSAYAASGGAFLGSVFKVTSDITGVSGVNAIGTADSNKLTVSGGMPFCGTLSGLDNDGTTVHSVSLSSPSGTDYNGLFGYTLYAEISELSVIYPAQTSLSAASGSGGAVGFARYSSLSGVSVTAVNGLTGSANTGGIIGYSLGSSVSESSFTGSVTGSSATGGIIGYDNDSDITISARISSHTNLVVVPGVFTARIISRPVINNSYVAGDVISTVTGSTQYTGGLIGYYSGYSAISNSFTFGNVTGDKKVGGLIGGIANGEASGLVANTYMRGDVSASDYAGGIIGYAENPAAESTAAQAITGSYFVGQIYCEKSVGAVCSDYVPQSGFRYDKQIAGGLALYGNSATDNQAAALATSEFGASATGVYSASVGFLTRNTGTNAIQNNSAWYSSPISGTPTGETSTSVTGYTYSVTDQSGNNTSAQMSFSYPLLKNAPANQNPENNFIITSNTRYGIASSSTSNSPYVDLSFTGTYVYLNDYFTGGSTAFDVYIDGIKITFDGATATSDTLSTNTRYSKDISLIDSNLFDAGTIAYGVCNKTPTTDYSCMVYNVANQVGCSFYVTGLKNSTHTIRIQLHYLSPWPSGNRTDQYLTFQGFTFGSDGSATEAAENYPQLSAFADTPISILSTQALYDFTENGENTAYSFRSVDGDDLTAKKTISTSGSTTGAVTYTNTSEAGGSVTLNGSSPLNTTLVTGTDTNTYNTTGGSGTFVINSQYPAADCLKGYTLSIKTKIIVTPFPTGNGTAESPFGIPNVSVLCAFRDYIENVSQGRGQYFRLTMGEDAGVSGNLNGYIYDLADSAQNKNPSGNATDLWNNPIGSAAKPFAGIFDGNEKLITNLNITALSANPADSTTYCGLFGYTDSAEIYDLTVEGGAILAPTDSGNNSKAMYAGLVVGKAFETSLHNITVRCDGKSVTEGQTLAQDFAYDTGLNKIALTYTSFNSSATAYNIKYIGAVAGYMYGDFTALKNILSVGKIEFTHTSTDEKTQNVSVSAGGIAGGITLTGTQTGAAENCIAKVDIEKTGTFSAENAYLTNRLSAVGGVFGTLRSASVFNAVNLASYGNLSDTHGYIGGITGCQYISGSAASYTGCTAGGKLSGGHYAYDGGTGTSAVTVGGIVGYTNNNTTLKKCIFHGELEVKKNGKAGALIGIPEKINSLTAKATSYETASSDEKLNYNFYDCSKNYGIESTIGGKYAVAYSTDRLIDGTAYRYACNAATGAVSSGTDDITFGSVLTAAIADKVILGNTIALHVVRNTPAIYAPTDTSEYSMGASSVYVLSDGATLSAVTALTAALRTYSGRRVVSTDDDASNAVLVKTVIMVDGTDTLSGLGKTFSYHPSVASTGRTDSSFIITDPDGDGVSTASGGVAGTPDGSFTIYTADQLMGIDPVLAAAKTTDGSGGTITTALSDANTIILGHDIDFGTSNYIDPAAYNTSVIGSSDRPLVSDINGNGHVVSNRILTTDQPNTGLFAVMNNITVSGLGLANSVFSSTASGANAGSFAGIMNGCTVENSFSSARVEQASDTPAGVYIGGFAGTVSGNTAFTRCAFTGSVGITAASAESYPTSAFSGTGNFYSGGLCGYISSGSFTATGSYVASYIHGDENADSHHFVGLFAGYKASAATTSITGCSADTKAAPNDCKPIGSEASTDVTEVIITGSLYPEIKNASGTAVFDNSNDYCLASRIAVSFVASASSMSSASVTYSGTTLSTDSYASGAFAVYGTAATPKYTLSDENRTITRTNNGVSSVTLKHGAGQRLVIMNLQCWYDNYKTDASGNKRYTIKNASELVELALIVNNKNNFAADPSGIIGHTHAAHDADDPTFSGDTVVLGADIDLSDISLYIPIGTAENPFLGTFDGNGHTVSGLTLSTDITGDGKADINAAGLFGNIGGGGTVENIIFTGASSVIASEDGTGDIYLGLVAGINNGTITGCVNASEVEITDSSSGNVFFGGIIGQNNSVLSGSYNMGYIGALTDSMTIAGIAGQNTAALSVCYNTGIISGFTNPSQLDYVCDTTAAGIAGQNTGSISNTYNAAVIRYCKAGAYNPIANSSGAGSVASSYFDGQIYSFDYTFSASNIGTAYSDSSVMQPTLALCSGTLPTGFSGSVWIARNGYYPTITLLSDASAEASQQASSRVSALAPVTTYEASEGSFDKFQKLTFDKTSPEVTVTENVAGNQGTFTREETANSIELTVNNKGTANIMLSDITESGQLFERRTFFFNETTYTVRYMFDFAELTDSADECALRTDGQNTDTFILNGTAVDSALTTGIGSAGDPYVISTADDLGRLAVFINTAGNSGGAGKYFVLSRDISYTDTYTPIGTEDNPFRGYFSGNGYEISGITATTSGVGCIGLFGSIAENARVELTGLVNCTFVSPEGVTSATYIGAFAGKCDGTITNCYSRSTVRANNPGSGVTLCAGGIVGELSSNGSLIGVYARPFEQTQVVDSGLQNNCLISYVTTDNGYSTRYYGGTLAGKSSGYISGCYHTSYYYRPVGVSSLAPYGVLVGFYAAGEITLSNHYDSTQLSDPNNYLYVYRTTASSANGARCSAGNPYAWTTAQFNLTEHAGADENGNANDSSALMLSKDMYLGSYENSPLPASHITNDSAYSNDGYPMLTAFDLSQYTFRSFKSTNLILTMCNRGSEYEKYMNALASYGTFSFPIYADITAKSALDVTVFALPSNISYNVSAVAYGYDPALETSGKDVKWTVLDGEHTTEKQLQNDADTFNYSAAGTHGSGMVSNTALGKATITMVGDNPIMPLNTSRLYVYIKLKRLSNPDTSIWGVHHSWDSSIIADYIPE